MPSYLYRCEQCGREAVEVNKVDERRTHAPECHGRMEIRIRPSHVVPDIKPYFCVVSDKVVTSRAERREMMKRYNVVEMGDGFADKHRKRLERLDRISGHKERG